jgi:signal transduction histidine kinase
VFRGRAYGVLVATDRLQGGPSFTREDERLLEAFAGSAATAVATAEAGALERRRQRLAAAEEERRRWARELHDETLQSLAAVRLGLASALRARDHQAIGEVLERAVAQLDGEIATLRSLITELRPAALDELGADAAIRALADKVSGLGLEVDVRLDLRHGDERLDADVETAAYRIVQESLTNARKHGEATHAVVEVVDDGSQVHISVRDDGRGFDPRQRSAGFGLLGMRERTELLAGTLDVDSARGAGTTVRATLPGPRRAHVA